MKLPTLPKYYLLFPIMVIALFSCKKDNSQELLYKAQNCLAANQADAAMGLLDSIQNPESMDKESYMRYIVAYVGAKYETGEDIKGDTLILEAQRYFDEKGNSEESILANYYAAQLYDESGNFPKALEAYMLTVYESQKSQNHLLAGNCLNNIGYIYFEKDLLDSAIVSYQKALSYYDKAENADNKKLITLTNIGRVFEDSKKLDSAYFYFDKCLSLAKQTENKTYQFHSLKNLGVVSYDKQEYEKAIDYFQSALALNVPDELEIQKINLYLLNIYNKKQDTKSAKQYADLVIASFPEVTYKYTAKEMCAALAEYYKQTGDYKQAYLYSNLEKITKEQIEREANTPALLEANKNFYLRQKEREAQECRSQLLMFGIGGAIALVIILFFVLLARRDNKKGKAEIQAHADRFYELRRKLHSMGIDNVEAEIKSILEDIDKEEEGNK